MARPKPAEKRTLETEFKGIRGHLPETNAAYSSGDMVKRKLASIVFAGKALPHYDEVDIARKDKPDLRVGIVGHNTDKLPGGVRRPVNQSQLQMHGVMHVTTGDIHTALELIARNLSKAYHMKGSVTKTVALKNAAQNPHVRLAVLELKPKNGNHEPIQLEVHATGVQKPASVKMFGKLSRAKIKGVVSFIASGGRKNGEELEPRFEKLNTAQRWPQVGDALEGTTPKDKKVQEWALENAGQLENLFKNAVSTRQTESKVSPLGYFVSVHPAKSLKK
jgi:hypothetical protein